MHPSPTRALTGLGLALALAAPSFAQQTVTYEVTFEATWSNTTHPGAYPSNAHFSPLIGATHNDSARLWQAGQLASNGIESMAETGSVSALTSEINVLRNAGQADLRLLGPAADSPDVVSFTFQADADFPLVSLVTMIAPSPDWFVGVDSLPLMENGHWVDRVVSLRAWDSGTDSGANFTSGNQNTNPAQPIALQTGGPFHGNDPLGTFTFRRVGTGSSYCGPAMPNSSGASARMLALGQANPGGPLTLCAEDLPMNQFGYFLVGSNTGMSTPMNSQGVLCLGGTLGRFNQTSEIRFSGPEGRIQLEIDTGSLPLNPSTPVLPGQTWYFQAWFREPGGQSNFTDGWQVTF